jgi:outer membrane cobalamin receptor
MLLALQALAQTGGISGQIYESETNEPLPGANVVVKGTSFGTTSDLSGQFSLANLDPGNYNLEISFIGFETVDRLVNVRPGQTTQLGTISINASSIGLEEIEVIASVAIDRKTPVAVTTIKGKTIEQKIGNQEFPEILRSTPSVYVTKQGGGFGDSRINVRGFDQRNTAVMINGIPVNDMENGWVYWSNWAGLSDVTSSMQVQRGLGATRLAVSSVGGSINIITNAAEFDKGGAFGVSVGNDGFSKYSLMLSTGLSETGWAFTMQGTHTRGNGYADGTLFRGYSYFASLAKQFNRKHSLHLTVLGAPQWHFQREYSNFDGVNIATIIGEDSRGIRYNPQWGYYDDSEYKDDLFSWRKNFYHKPKAFLNHYWTISDKTELGTSVYASLGRGGGTGDLGRINGSFRTSGKFKNERGIVRWNDIDRWNSGQSVADFGNDQVPWSGPGVTTENPGYSGPFAGQSVAESNRNGFILRSSMNEHNWFGLLSNLTHEFTDQLKLTAGLDARYYKGLHYRRVEDLMGLDAYFDDDDINMPVKYITAEGREDGNQIDYNNDGLVNWLGLYAQLEYTLEKLSLFGSFSGSNQGFKRIDYFNYLDSDPQQETDWQNFLGGTAKAGANYNINDRHNVFLNGGYFSQQPIFDNVFLNFRNDINESVENQNIYALELGYGYRSSVFSANVNLYHTYWGNRQLSRGSRQVVLDPVTGDELQVDGNANFTNIEQLHQGLELDFSYKPLKSLTINGMFSYGNWRYTDNFNAVWVPEDDIYANQAREQTLYMEDVKVPDAAQTTLALDATFELLPDLRFFASYYFADRVYSDFDLASIGAFSTPGNQAWQLPAYSLVDLGLYYNLDFGGIDMTINANINNVLDEQYISESESTILFNPDNAVDQQYGEIGVNGSYRNIAYFGFGRTWNIGLKVRF